MFHFFLGKLNKFEAVAQHSCIFSMERRWVFLAEKLKNFMDWYQFTESNFSIGSTVWWLHLFANTNLASHPCVKHHMIYIFDYIVYSNLWCQKLALGLIIPFFSVSQRAFYRNGKKYWVYIKISAFLIFALYLAMCMHSYIAS